MLVLSKIYKCDVCGNIVQILHEGAGELVCCHQAMLKLKEQSADFKTEKHVPIIEQRDCGFLIKVGSTLHPMEDKHFIEWIELIADGVSYFKYLKPGDTPEIFFHIEAKEINAREYCNIHGLWRN